MKNKLYILILMVACVSCTTEEPTQQYTTAIRNTSDKPLKILILGNGENRNTPVYDTLVNTTLNAGDVVLKSSYKTPSFAGFHNGIYSIDIYYTKISFLDNNKGYICEKDSLNNLCFQNKVSLTEAYYEHDFTFENGIYYYDITQKDYENAHVLP